MTPFFRKILDWGYLIILIPSVYFTGWIFANFIKLLGIDIRQDDFEILTIFLSFLLFIFVVPLLINRRWGIQQPWHELGIKRKKFSSISFQFLKGLTWALLFLLIVLVPIHLGGWLTWKLELSSAGLLNAFLLMIGVGFAEELIFRGWLWGELNQIVGSSVGIFWQAGIFSLVHIRSDIGFVSMISLLTGLFLLGLVLGLMRRLDQGSLWGCVGLHGGLVGGWFCLNDGFVKISVEAPSLFVGPGGDSSNPIGGISAIIILLAMISYQITALAKAPRP